MSAGSGFNNIRTTTTLGIAGLITLASVAFMAYSYYAQTQNAEKFQERSVQFHKLTDHINAIRWSIQWVYSYESDVVFERSISDVRSGIYLNWEKVNIFNRSRHMATALEAMSQIEPLLRTDADKLLAQELAESLNGHAKRLLEESNRNLANEQIAQEALDTGNEALLDDIDTSSGTSGNSISVLYAVDSKLNKIEELRESYRDTDTEQLAKLEHRNTQFFYLSMILVFSAIFISFLLFRAGILSPLGILMNTIERVRGGEDDARTGLQGQSELLHLGTVMDELFDEKDATSREQEKAREELNASVISLIQNVFKLSQRDLSIRVPVAEDITGAVSDSINQLADSMDSTLHEVIRVSKGVNETSTLILSQSERVREHSDIEKVELQKALGELDSVIRAMQMIAHLATSSHQTSKQAITTSEAAMSSVSETIVSINRIRQTIGEAEKRIKRLGERSQEIGGIVSLINNISERTHVLSLNASMHAASAGEAGRGLTVVVDEVQRLAENSREATAEIETLVNNIQLETNDTIEVINTVITEVVNGTRLAEEAGERMDSTRKATHSLVESVVKIAKSAVNQAKVAKQLHQMTSSVSESASETSIEMERQTELSEQLVTAATSLQDSVSVFQLTDKSTS